MRVFTITDFRNAARGLRHAPMISVSAILCLALGLGSTAAISSAISRALLQPLPFKDPDKLVTVYRTAPQADSWPFAPANYVDLARTSRQLSDLAAIGFTTGLVSLPTEGGGMQVSVVRATGNLFPMLGVHAVRGRLLTPTDDAAGSDPVVVLSEELWGERFGGDPALLGRSIRLDGKAQTVVGILPDGFGVPHGSGVLRGEVWVPMRFSEQERTWRGNNFLSVLGRLAPGSTPVAAQAEMRRIFDGIAQAFPQLRGEGIRIVPLQADASRAVRTPLLLLFGAVCMVLLIAATNVASLLLARGVQRRREMAVRTALGASRWAVMRPVLAESLVLAVVGGVAGLGLAGAGVRTIGALAAEHLPQLAGLGIDWRVLLFALVLSALVSVVCGGMPAWHGASVDPQEALRGGRGGGPDRAHHRALGALVVSEVALSLILLIGAGLVLKGFAKLLRNDPGFDPRPLLTLEVAVPPEHYPDTSSVRRFLEPVLSAIRQQPGVAAAAAISLVPYDNWGWNSNIRYEGQPPDNPTQNPLAEDRFVTPDFFRVTGQRLLAGRLLREADDDARGTPTVVVVNEALAKRDFAGRDPVGKRFYIGDTTFATIVGVVSDIRNVGPVAPPSPETYYSYLQADRGASNFPIMVRVKGDDPMAVVGAVRAAVHGVDRDAAITRVRPMTEVMARSVGRPRFYLTLLAVFAVVALALAVAGLYGMMSYAVAQRTREIGIRTALGSTKRHTVRLVGRHGLTLVGAGVILGLLGGAAVTRLLQGMLYGVSPVDATTWALTTGLLTGVGLVATVVPALRAAQVDPVIAMRVE